jgi:phosphoribosylamine--glycine ligase
MGAYTPLPWAPADLVEEVTATVLQPTVDELARRGTPFAGLLYSGLALTARGTRVIEFNARFGDPETQPLLARLVTPIGELLSAAATGALAGHAPLQWRPESAVGVVLAAENYPGTPLTGGVITGLDEAAIDGRVVVQAGTAFDGEGRVVSSGGRVLTVVGLGDDLGAAREAAYEGIEQIGLAGSFYRRDIAERAVAGEIAVAEVVR